MNDGFSRAASAAESRRCRPVRLRIAAGLVATAFVLPHALSAATQTGSARQPVRAPAPLLTAQRTTTRTWRTIGRSRGSRPMQAMTLGDGSWHVLVIGSVAGDDPAAIALMDRLASRLSSNESITGGFTCTLLRTANPDGAALHRPTNAAGVRLSTAFPPPGRSVAAEPETRVVLDLIRRLRPDRIVHITRGRAATPVVLHNTAASPFAQELAEWLHTTARPNTHLVPQGSLEHHAGESAEVITLLTPPSTTADNAWARFADSLLASLAPPNEPEAESESDWPPPTATRQNLPPVQRSGRTSVEVLPPPPSTARKSGK